MSVNLNDEIQRELQEVEEMVEEAKQHENYTEKVFILREGMIKLAGGFAQAALLSSLLGWTRHWLKTDNEVYKQIQKAAENKDLKAVRKLKDQIRQGWFWKAYREMSDELLNQVSPKTCERYVEKFEEMGLIWSRDPEEKAVYRAKWYKANIDKIKEELNKLGFELDHFKDQKDSTRQNDESENKGFQKQKVEKTAPLRTRQNDEPPRQNDEPSRQNDEHLLYLHTSSNTSFNSTSRYVGSEQPNPVETFSKDHKLTKYARNELDRLISIYGPMLVDEAIKRATKNESSKPISYITSILGKWAAAGIQTLEGIEAYEKQFRESVRGNKSVPKQPKQPKQQEMKLPKSVAELMEQQKQLEQPEKKEISDEELSVKQARLQEKLKLMTERLNKRKQERDQNVRLDN